MDDNVHGCETEYLFHHCSKLFQRIDFTSDRGDSQKVRIKTLCSVYIHCTCFKPLEIYVIIRNILTSE